MEKLQYNEERPIIYLNRGEVRRFQIVFPRKDNTSHLMWGNIQEGEFVYPPMGTQQESAYRAVYKKVMPPTGAQDNATEDVLLLTIDTRSTLKFDIDQDDPNFGKIVDIHIYASEAAKECILSIDLGNTRTVSLLIDKVDDMQLVSDESNGINIYRVPMFWSEYPKKDAITGGFESIISLVNSSNRVGSWCFDDCRFSFIKLGEFAVWNNRACRKSSDSGRYTLSSPKRYYWDKDPVDMEWIAARYSTDNVDAQIEPLRNTLAAKLVETFEVKGEQPISHLPPASLLAAMVVELYEQAVYYVSSLNFKQKTNDKRPRKITTVHITYPSTLSPEEKENYRQQLQSGLNTYLSLCTNTDTQVTLRSDIDEATSVLALYVFSEIKNFVSAKFWLQTVGRKTAGGDAARIAVIDVGGGTTDLSISNVFASDYDAALDPARAAINLIFRDGVNSAGDNLILTFLKNYVANIGFQEILKLTQISSAELDAIKLKELYNNPKNSGFIRGLKRSFWFDFVIGLAAKCDSFIETFPKGSKEGDDYKKFKFEFKLADDAAASWKKFFKDVAGEGDREGLKDAQITVQITENLVNAYKAAVASTFTSVAKSFGRSIFAYDTDVVLFSGKTAEFFYVREFFKDYMPVSSLSIKPMKDFYVGDWCSEITDTEGRVNDSKISTALGGALYTLREKAFVTMDFKLDALASNPNCRWGIVPKDKIAFAVPLFAPGEIEKTIEFTNVSKFIARQNELATTAVLSYEVRLKPDKRAEHDGGVAPGATVTLEKDTRSMSLKLTGCQGTYLDGNQLLLDDIECRICNLSSTFGLDNDRI